MRRQKSLERLPRDPTEKQIAQACAEIQSRWTPAERERRQVCVAPLSWTVPTVQIDQIDAG